MKCNYCDIEFVQTRGNQKFCSKKCRENYWNRKSYINNREKRLAYAKSSDVKERRKVLNKRPEIKRKRNAALKVKWRTDPLYKIKMTIIDRVRHDESFICKMNGLPIEKYLNDSLIEILEHLIVTIPYHLSIEDYLKGYLSIDHIIPYRWFLFLKPGDEEFRKCWNKRNLRLIPFYKNFKRKRSIDWEEIKRLGIGDLLPCGADIIWKKKLEKLDE